MMNSARWERIQALFHRAADLPPEQRLDFLTQQCPSDPALAAEVMSLLAEDSRPSPFDATVAQAAHRLLDSSDRADVPSTSFGPYRLLRVLGEGGMGIVYLAARPDLGNEVAIKILRDAWLSPARRERFAAEQRTLAQLSHPLIARLYDANAARDGTPFFVMEYVEGLPLTQYCHQRACSLDSRLRLLHAVCEAVHYAHQHAVIHRDLKPSNILVKADGSVRLLDFGIAKPLQVIDEAAGATTHRTLTGLRLMTPAYASPEQLRGDPVGVQSDVFSLGVILYELLTGRLPSEPSPAAPSQAPRVLTANRAAWDDLDVLCLTALHPDLHRRYASVEALMRDVDHFLNREPLEARPDSLAYRLSRFLERRRRPVAAAAAVVLAVAGLIVYFTLRLKSERDAANRQTAIATAVNTFLADDLLGRGNPFQSGQASQSLTAAIHDASPSIDRKFAADPLTAARLHLTIAQALDGRSDFAQAGGEYERAHRLFLSVGGANSQDAIASQLQRAAMEARSFQAQGLERARTLIAQQQSLLQHLPSPRPDLFVRLHTAQGMLALVQGDALAANHFFKQASDEAATLPQFDQTARFDLQQRLAFTYIRLGDGATAERLARQLIAAYALQQGPASGYVLRMRLNLAQAYMIERKFPASVAEASAVYPDFVRTFGPDHQLTMQLLTTRAQSEGSLGRFDDSTRDDLAIYRIAVAKQGPLSFYAIATLSDASVAQCRANHLTQGLQSARQAHSAAVRGFGPGHALTQATLLPLANCLIPLGQLSEAARDLDRIDPRQVAPLAGDPDWGAGIGLARAEIALRQHRFAEARTQLAAVRPVFSRPTAEAYDRDRWQALAFAAARHQ